MTCFNQECSGDPELRAWDTCHRYPLPSTLPRQKVAIPPEPSCWDRVSPGNHSGNGGATTEGHVWGTSQGSTLQAGLLEALFLTESIIQTVGGKERIFNFTSLQILLPEVEMKLVSRADGELESWRADSCLVQIHLGDCEHPETFRTFQVYRHQSLLTLRSC